MGQRAGLYDPATDHDACGVGFVAHVKGEKSRSIVTDALEVLRRLAHRGACGADPETGDGAGILLQLPHRFFKARGLELGFDMPRRRRYGVGQVFLPPDPAARAACERVLEEVVVEEGQRVLGWRDVPTDPSRVGPTARAVMPVFRQLYVRMRRVPPSAYERTLYVIRKRAEHRIRELGVDPGGAFHVASLSTETIVYKGLLLPGELGAFYLDLAAPDLVAAIAVVHSRFSTNTFPTWDLAQPFRFIAHNGEINTLRGNLGWIDARRSQLKSAKFKGGLERLHPIIERGKSDSAQFDNLLELLVLGGRSVPHAMMMMIPEAWEGSASHVSEERRAFYRYASSLVEPWDGPAAIVFTDGFLVGATLDRNGLRPARWLQTSDDRVVLASEVGVIDVPAEKIVARGRLQPGRMFVVDTTEGRIVADDEIKHDIAGRFPYRKWLEANVFELDELEAVAPPPAITGDELDRQLRAFGYTDEDLHVILGPMAATGKEPTGSMGTDTPLAVLSDQSPNLFAYFHQLFAQVTNPPIDPIREALVMTLETNIGPDGNTFDETPESCHQIRMPGPFLDNAALARIVGVGEGTFETRRLSTVFEPGTDDDAGLSLALMKLCDAAVHAIDDGASILVLSDRGVDARRVPIPSLLALAAVNQRLVKEGIRMQAGLLVETGEAREVHDLALLIGYGAAAVNPYLALDAIAGLVELGAIEGPAAAAQARYLHACDDGLLKIMSKMGISTVQSYRGAQIFEAVGLSAELCAQALGGTPSRLGGLGVAELAREALDRHDRGYGRQATAIADRLPVGGLYAWRRRGERHKWNPTTIATLQAAVHDGDRAQFAAYERACDDEDGALVTLRSLLELVPAGPPVPLDEVEPVGAIVARFVTGAMSFGSMSAEAHETLAIAMNRLGARSNSGEGGEEPHRFTPDEHGDLRRSAIKQVASGRFGVTAHYLVHADDLQIKIAQGAKPGEGGQLPGGKVDERIAKVRCSTPGVTLISPPPHHDIYSIEDLAQLVYDLQAVNPTARVSVKLVSEIGVGTIAAGVAKARAGGVVIAGYEGGTGASPLSSLRHAGLPWELGLAETQQVLVQHRLRGRVRLQVDGGLRTARDVVIATLLGAEEYGLATASLVATGCVMLRKCHLNTCSVGIATQDPRLRERYRGRPEDVVRFFTMIAERVRELCASLGARTLDELVGRTELLRARPSDHWKARTLDLAPLLHRPAGDRLSASPREAARSSEAGPRDATVARRFVAAEPWPLADHVDEPLCAALAALPADQPVRPIERRIAIVNRQRAAGARLAGDIARRWGAHGLPDGTIKVHYTGSAGQSFGAWLTAGVELHLEGDANDYVGKGLSGGRLAIRPPAGARFAAEDAVIIGNTALYGATGGELFARGQAGERFAVRNSGARAVVEGCGDHGCEYMTGGAVVVLGATGRNFAAGMSGGVAYVFDRDQTFRARLNPEMVELEPLVDESDLWLVHGLIEDHVRLTGSPRGKRILDNWDNMAARFIKVMPTEYKRVLEKRRAAARPRIPMPVAAAGGQ
ncbi:MAG TPA: glutamate synthase large subunit [Kofleriaceae bacterium]|nr:glutamate synthase large subunit [Kofleriaceae bacterium]